MDDTGSVDALATIAHQYGRTPTADQLAFRDEVRRGMERREGDRPGPARRDSRRPARELGPDG